MSERRIRFLIVPGAVILALLWVANSGQVLRPLLSGIQVPYLSSVLINLGDLAMMCLMLALAGGMGAGRSGPGLLGLAGLWAPVKPALIWALFLFVPAILLAALAAPVSDGLNATELFWQGVGFPVIEEIVFRGLAIGALMRWASWSLWPACLLPAAVFGLVHMGQGSDLGSIAGITLITGSGGLLFGWLYARWRFNLWPPILLHIGMNSLWIVFALGETALGGWLGNGVRLAIVAASIFLTLRMVPPEPKAV